jgi:hypothetical protein
MPSPATRVDQQRRTFGDTSVQNTSFAETQTILRALEFAMARGGFGGNVKQKKMAAVLIRRMQSNKSVSGRHLQLMSVLKRGATIDQMIKVTGSSRRTIFRYLNHLEEAGFDIIITDGKYKFK